ncbi:beta-galactosidase [Grosmannia clavigera kw1407]|uniref:Beta-galactosidase n=1 Tax=Grosmannia clavigera (strain kw1407 / UAMH 11150) TaxID=655863 RepID=F0XJW1_GROCL|nr:beta-galactosidase [Grosmannia clavigera kw1407]EFX02392.1 beta-galactosidase [Grosmannia clavigera kw1407]
MAMHNETAAAAAAAAVATTRQPADRPRLHRTADGATQLLVHGRPYLMRAGELHNSSLSSPAYMADVWPTMQSQAINTLLGAVAWEDIEPTEGCFDFGRLDAILADARAHEMHLVLLWFGTYKNAVSTYVPAWVKRDVRRFPRVHVNDEDGRHRTLEMVSPLSEAAVEADSRAFAALMRHLAAVDTAHSTVLMVQVENETGLLGDSRDRSPVAEAAFAQPVPPPLLQHLLVAKTAGTLHPRFTERFPDIETTAAASNPSWHDVFGPGTRADEAFMAYHVSRFVGRVAAAGKALYPIPLYTNTWLNFDDPTVLDLHSLPVVVGGGALPGIYPSGGPCPHMLDIWRHSASALDFIAPDLYFHDYETVCRDYTAQANPLFIPEQRRDPYGARRVWLALATYGALGTAPFGIDTGAETIGREYRLLAQTEAFLLAAAPQDRMGFFFDEPDDSSSKSDTKQWTRVFGDFELIVEQCFVFGKPGPGAGMVIHRGHDRFLLVGRGFHVRFRSVRPEATFCGILRAEEKEVGPDGQLHTLRVLNGDETRSGEFVMMPNDDPDYGGFPIAVTIPARTCIAEVEAYWVQEEVEDL